MKIFTIARIKTFIICILLYKVWCFIGISDIYKTDNLTEIIYDKSTCENYRFSKNHHSLFMIFYIARKDCSLYNKQI